MSLRHTMPCATAALLAAALLAPAAADASTGRAAPSATPDVSAAARTSPVSVPVLTWVRASHVGGADRVVFGFSGGVPTSVQPTWVTTLVHDGSGLPVRIAGARVLSLVMTGAVAHDQHGPTTPGRTAFALPNVVTAVRAGDFESTVTFGLGVVKRTAYRIRTKAHRVVVEVEAAFPTSTRQVWFVDRDAVSAGHEPHVRAVTRPVPTDAPAAAALHALFAGPTRTERSDGLRAVLSHAWEFDGLAVSGGIARLRLTHGCNSGGSTVTVADEIFPTLKQFPSVDWVKIYGPGGRTERPDGPSDSIPVCLEP